MYLNLFKRYIYKCVSAFLFKKEWRQSFSKCLGIHMYGEFRWYLNEIKNKKLNLDDESKFVESVFVGSSHVSFGFNPKYFGKEIFNFGSISQDLFTSYNLLELYNKK